MVVTADSTFCSRRDNRAWQLVVFHQAVRQGLSVNGASTLCVHGPDAGIGGAGNVIAHHHFDRQHVQLLGDDHVGVGIVDDMVWANVGGVLKPKSRGCGQHMALVGDGGEDMIKCGLAVGGNHQPPSVAQIIAFAHFAALKSR